MADLFPWYPLAKKALLATVDEDYDTGTDAINELVRTYGPTVVPAVLLALVDTMLGHTVVPASPDALAFLETGSGAIQGADEVPPPVRWAGRLVMARACDDHATFTALIDSVTTDEQWSANCNAVLNMCGLNIRRAKEAAHG